MNLSHGSDCAVKRPTGDDREFVHVQASCAKNWRWVRILFGSSPAAGVDSLHIPDLPELTEPDIIMSHDVDLACLAETRYDDHPVVKGPILK